MSNNNNEGVGCFFVLIAAVVSVVIATSKPTWAIRWWYHAYKNIPAVMVNPKPHDCDFITAPLGSKHCHYEMVKETVMWATSMKGEPIKSTDDGKSWYVTIPGKCYFDGSMNCHEPTDPPDNKAPTYPTTTGMYISWNKVED